MILGKMTLLLVSSAVIVMAGGAAGKVMKNDEKDPSRDALDTNGYKYVTNYCKEVETSGVLMIRNKNLDYDRNNVFFKHQRITYVIPDKFSLSKKRCYHEISTGINEVDMRKLMKKLD